MEALSVSQLNTQIKALLEATFLQVCVCGEVSNLTYHASGHIYFSIKDAQSSIRCVMFRGNASKLKFRIEAGMHITIFGAISLYVPKGEYQLNCSHCEPVGAGALALAYEQLKGELERRGYFDPSHKKRLPLFPRHIAIVTSPSGAALQDMIRIATKRWPLLRISVVPALVQGDGAASDIATALGIADRLNADCIVVGRGGGSLEDLWAFNEIVVAEAIFACATPVISAIGHETDTMLSDFVADARAPTPSGAMELLLPDQNEWLVSIDGVRDLFMRTFCHLLERKERDVTTLKVRLEQSAPLSKIERLRQECEVLRGELHKRVEFLLLRGQKELLLMRQAYQRSHPHNRVTHGFAQVTKSGSAIGLDEVVLGDMLVLCDGKNRLDVSVQNIKRGQA